MQHPADYCSHYSVRFPYHILQSKYSVETTQHQTGAIVAINSQQPQPPASMAVTHTAQLQIPVHAHPPSALALAECSSCLSAPRCRYWCWLRSCAAADQNSNSAGHHTLRTSTAGGWRSEHLAGPGCPAAAHKAVPKRIHCTGSVGVGSFPRHHTHDCPGIRDPHR